MQKVVAIIQARMSSQRLPNKVMQDIAGHPMLWHVIERVRRCETVDHIVVATTSNEEDRVLIELAASCGVIGFAGDEHDVLKRYIQAAESHDGEVIVRVTADCPLINPSTIDRMVNRIDALDYVCLDPSIITFETGLEVVTLSGLKKLNQMDLTQSQREHVTLALRENPEKFNIDVVVPDPNFQRSDLRITVDHKEDLDFIQEVYKELYREGEIIDLYDVVKLVDEKPELLEINKQASISQANQLSLSDEVGNKILESVEDRKRHA